MANQPMYPPYPLQYAQSHQPPQPPAYAQPQPPQGYPQGYPPVPPAPTQYAPQQPPQQPQGAAGLPTIHLPDESVVNAAYAAAQAEAERVARARSGGGGSKSEYWNPKTPINPATGRPATWEECPPGTKVDGVVWVCPPWAPGQMPFVQTTSHFWKSQRAPRGTSVSCPGDGRCPICAARSALYRTGSKADAETANNNGRPKHNTYYQVIDLENPQDHVGDDGQMRPFIFRIGSGLQEQIVNILQDLGKQAGHPALGVRELCDPMGGRPIRVVKHKKGPRPVDTEWSVSTRDKQQLAPSFWPILYNLHDLTKQEKVLTQEEARTAIMEIGFPMTQECMALINQLPSSPQQPYNPSMHQQVRG